MNSKSHHKGECKIVQALTQWHIDTTVSDSLYHLQLNDDLCIQIT